MSSLLKVLNLTQSLKARSGATANTQPRKLLDRPLDATRRRRRYLHTRHCGFGSSRVSEKKNIMLHTVMSRHLQSVIIHTYNHLQFTGKRMLQYNPQTNQIY
jgi:hypothetical protein